MKKRSSEEDIESKIAEVMSLMGQRSAEVRRKKWGKKEFKKRMQDWGKLGGRPRTKRGEGK